MSRLTDALVKRFDEFDEVKDVANYGCAAGVSGFIYYNECIDFFNEYQADIEDHLELIIGDDYIQELTKDDDLRSNNNVGNITQLINKMVWVIVEDYCTTKVLEKESETLYQAA